MLRHSACNLYQIILAPLAAQEEVVKEVMVFERVPKFDPARPVHPIFQLLEEEAGIKCDPWGTPFAQAAGCPNLLSVEWRKKLEKRGTGIANACVPTAVSGLNATL